MSDHRGDAARRRSLLRAPLPVSAVFGAALAAGCGGPTFTLAADAGRSGDAMRADVSQGDGAPRDAGAPTDAPRDGMTDAGAFDAPRGDAYFSFRKLRTVVGGRGTLHGIAVDGDAIYWAENPTASAIGALERATKVGGSVTPLTSLLDAPLDVVADDTNLYVSVHTTPGVASTETTCLAATIAKTASENSLATCLAKAAFTTVRIAINEPDVFLLVVSGQNDPMLGSVPKKNGGDTLTMARTGGPSQSLTASGDTLFVGDSHGPHIDSFSTTSLDMEGNLCSSTCVGNMAGDEIEDILVDETAPGAGVAWWVSVDGEFLTEALGADPSTGMQVGMLPGMPQRMARDANYIYVTTLDDSGASTGSVIALPVTGTGGAVVLATAIPAPFGIATDGTNVFFTCNDGAIRAVGVPDP